MQLLYELSLSSVTNYWATGGGFANLNSNAGNQRERSGKKKTSNLY
jgi:hypothetical protein